MRIQFINWLEAHMSACPFKQMTGHDCIGCGVQRSAILLLEGNITGSIYMYPALIPMSVLFFALVFHLIFKFKKGGLFIMYNFIAVVALMVLNYLYKLLF